MIEFIKHICTRGLSIYSKFNPLIFQYWYTHKTLKEKRNTISFISIDIETKNKIRSIWKKINQWHIFYYTIGDREKTHLYFPDNMFYKFVDYALNDWRKAPIIDDKNLYDLYFYDVPRPKTIARLTGGILQDGNYNMITMQDVESLCTYAKNVIIKVPYGSSGGHGIKFWQTEEKVPLRQVLSSFNSFTIQEIVKQHNELSKLHPSSLNTVRFMTMIDEEDMGGVKVLSAIVRMGINESRVDNVSSGGVACGINTDGSLKSFAYDGCGRRYCKHPQGAKFEDSTIPNYQECVDLCKRLAPRIARFSKLVSWDFAISEDGYPLLIEANLYGGELDFHQMCNGPIFKDEETTKEMIRRFILKKK